jgi:hypothetical protein
MVKQVQVKHLQLQVNLLTFDNAYNASHIIFFIFVGGPERYEDRGKLWFG